MNGTPNVEKVSTFARAFSVVFTESFIDILDNDDEDVVFFIYVNLAELWDKRDVCGMYLYLVLRCGSEGIHVPRELVWIAHDESLLNIYMEHFIDEYAMLMDIDGNWLRTEE